MVVLAVLVKEGVAMWTEKVGETIDRWINLINDGVIFSSSFVPKVSRRR